MQYNSTYSKNISELKNCQRWYKSIFAFYAFICIPNIAWSLIMIVISPYHDELNLFLDGVIFKLLIFAAATMGVYKNQNLYAIAASLLLIVNVAVFNYSSLDIAYIIISIAATIINCIVNRKYKLLEQCEGFPYFNERFEEYKETKEKDVDTFKESYDELKKLSLTQWMISNICMGRLFYRPIFLFKRIMWSADICFNSQ